MLNNSLSSRFWPIFAQTLIINQKNKNMKKTNFWLLASLFVAAFTLTACGDDDDDDNTNSTSVVGKWSAFVKAVDESMMGRYDHYLVYEFKSDNTFTITTAYYGTSTEAQYAQYAMKMTADDYQYPSGQFVLDSELYRFTGTYTDANSQLTLNVKKWAFYDRQENKYQEVEGEMGFEVLKYNTSKREWEYNNQYFMSNAVPIPYKISGNKLILFDENTCLSFQYHSMLTSTLTRK